MESAENSVVVEPDSLARKLVEVGKVLGYIGKDGTNDFHHYDYVTAEAVLGAVRKPLYEAGVFILPHSEQTFERSYTTSQGRESTITRVRIRYRLINADDPSEFMEVAWEGEGDDPADKGLGKAKTNCAKLFLRALFLLPQGDDPEADRATDERAVDRVEQSKIEGPEADALRADCELLFNEIKKADPKRLPRGKYNAYLAEADKSLDRLEAFHSFLKAELDAVIGAPA